MDLPIFDHIKEIIEELGYYVDNHPENSEFHFVIRSGQPCNKMDSRLRSKLEEKFEYDRMGKEIHILYESGKKRKKSYLSLKEKEIEHND